MSEDIYTKHKPIVFKDKDGVVYYCKTELDDNFLFRKTKSISINAKTLEKVDAVLIYLKHRNATLRASKKEIKEYEDVKTFKREVKYYYPVEDWEVISGDTKWTEKL